MHQRVIFTLKFASSFLVQFQNIQWQGCSIFSSCRSLKTKILGFVLEPFLLRGTRDRSLTVFYYDSNVSENEWLSLSSQIDHRLRSEYSRPTLVVWSIFLGYKLVAQNRFLEIMLSFERYIFNQDHSYVLQWFSYLCIAFLNAANCWISTGSFNSSFDWINWNYSIQLSDDKCFPSLSVWRQEFRIHWRQILIVTISILLLSRPWRYCTNQSSTFSFDLQSKPIRGTVYPALLNTEHLHKVSTFWNGKLERI